MDRILVIGDNVGVPRLLRHLDPESVRGIVGAEIRPQYLDELRARSEALQVPLLVQPRSGSAAAPGFARQVAELAPELILCDSYSMLLPEPVLAVPTRGAVNVHGGLLPDYRGSNPIQWAIIDGRSEAGVTMHYMDSGFDTGDVISERRVSLLFTDTWLDVSRRVAEATETMLAEEVPRILRGNVSRTKQPPGVPLHRRRRTPEDGRFDWDRPVREIYNLVRALVRPLPGAFYLAHRERHVLDAYLSIAEVCVLKQRFSPNDLVDGCRLNAIEAASNDPLRFNIVDVTGHGSGSVDLHSIDYAAGRARVNVSLTGDGCDSGAVLDAVKRFARTELDLAQVDA